MNRGDEPSPRDLERARELFLECYKLVPAERDRFLSSACGDNAALRRAVDELLGHHDEPAPEIAALEEKPDSAASPKAPDQIGPYRIDGILGRGGMGIVYRATQQKPHRTVALKVLQPGLVRDDTLKRFEKEAEVLGMLQHPGIASIFDAGTCDFGYGDLPYFAMELVDGEPITAFAETHELDTGARLALVASVCDAVQHAHDCGVVHRDLKPGNILVTKTKTGSGAPLPKVLDFGIARTTDASVQLTMQTNAGQILGTLPYMSPEQVAGGLAGIDARSDVYSLGVILYELLAGKLPLELEGRPLTDAGRVVSDQDPTLLGRLDRMYRGDVETITDKALAKEKERRYGSVAELAEDLRRYLRNEPIAARPQTTWYQIQKFARRNRALVGGVIASMAILVAGLVGTLVYAAEASALAESESAARQRADRVAAAHRMTAYHADMRLAGAALSTPSSHGRIRGIVQRWKDNPEGAADLRGWEFDLLDAHTRTLATHSWKGRYLSTLRYWRELGELAIASRRIEQRGERRLAVYETCIVDPASGEMRRVVHRDRALNNLSPDGELGIEADKFRCRIVRRATGEEVTRWATAGHTFHRFQWTRDGRYVAMNAHRGRTSSAESVTVRRVSDGEVVASFPVAFRTDLALAGFSSDGRWLAVAECNDARGRISLFSTSDWQRANTFTSPGSVMVLRWQPGHGAFAVANRRGEVYLYDSETGERTQLDGHEHVVAQMQWRADGEVLASSAKDGTVRLHFPRTGRSYDVGSAPRGISSLLWSPDGTKVACVTGALTILDVETPPAVRELVRAGGRSQLVWHPDGKSIAVGFRAKTRLIDVATGAAGIEIDGTHVRLNRDASLAASRKGHILRVHDMRDDSVMHSHDFSEHGLGEYEWHPTENRLGVATRRRLWAWTPAAGAPTAFRREANMGAVYWRPPGSQIGATFGRAITMTDTGTGEARQLMNSTPSFDAAWDPTGTVVAVAMQRQHVMLVRDEPRSYRRLDGHGGEVLCVAWSPDGERLASGSRDKTVRLWDPVVGAEVLTLEHGSIVTSVAWSPDGRVLATQTVDGRVRLWDTSRATR